MPCISLSNISYTFPNGFNLLKDISVSFGSGISGLIGVNGCGKSTLSKIAAGILQPTAGSVSKPQIVKYLPQISISPGDKSIVDLLDIGEKFRALKRISAGIGDENDFMILDDDWLIEERINRALNQMGLTGFDPTTPAINLSGGEIVRTTLASLFTQNYEFVILDEPTNHLDKYGRDLVVETINIISRSAGVIIVSHDRHLLRQVNRIFELSNLGIKVFGGNYDFYHEIRTAEIEAAQTNLMETQKELKAKIRKAHEVIGDQLLRTKVASKTMRDSGIPTIMLDKLKDTGEKSLKRTIETHNKRIEESHEKLLDAKKNVALEKKVKFDFREGGSRSSTLFACTEINIAPGGKPLWQNQVTFSISKNDRIRITGVNGSGKSSLCRVITGELPIITGEVTHLPKQVIYFDQTLSFLDPEKTILENALEKGNFIMSETEIRIRLGRLGFYGEDCKKPVSSLSGGELIRAAVGVLVSMPEAPSLLILDEPTNNLDLKGIEMLSTSLRNFRSALLVITHDDDFASDLGITEEIQL